MDYKWCIVIDSSKSFLRLGLFVSKIPTAPRQGQGKAGDPIEAPRQGQGKAGDPIEAPRQGQGKAGDPIQAP